jgi:hypothetical protein
MYGMVPISGELVPSRPLQPWSDAARSATRAAVGDLSEQELMRRAKVLRFQDRMADMIVDDEAEAQPWMMMLALMFKAVYAATLGGLTYLVVWLTRGSGWSPDAIATGVASAVGLAWSAAHLWHRYRHPELEPPEADIHAPERWSVLRRS